MKKSTNPTLPSISGAELMRYAREGVIAEADGLLREVKRAMSGLNPAVLVAVAVSRTPEQPAAVAFERFKREVTELLSLLSARSEELQAAQRAEQHRLAGVVAAAAHRTLEIVSAVSGIESRIRHGENANLGKRDRLSKEGLSGAELDLAAAPFDPTELRAERAALLIEGEALENFLKSRDPQHIPEGFADDVREAA